MKRIFMCLLTVLMSITLFGCSKSETVDPQKELEENYTRHTFDDMIFYTPKDYAFELSEGDHYYDLESDKCAFYISGFLSEYLQVDEFMEYTFPDYEIRTTEKGISYVIEEDEQRLVSARTNDIYFYIIMAAVYDDEYNLIEEATVDLIEKLEVDPSVIVEKPEEDTSAGDISATNAINIRELTFYLPEEYVMQDLSSEFEDYIAFYDTEDDRYALFVDELTRSEVENAGFTEESLIAAVFEDKEGYEVSESGKVYYYAYEEGNYFYVYSFISATDSFYDVFQACMIADKDIYYPTMLQVIKTMEIR